MLPEVAVILALPEDIPAAKPLVVTVAIVLLLDVHATDPVTSLCVPFEYLAVAVNCSVPPTFMAGFDALTAIAVIVAAVLPTDKLVLTT